MSNFIFRCALELDVVYHSLRSISKKTFIEEAILEKLDRDEKKFDQQYQKLMGTLKKLLERK